MCTYFIMSNTMFSTYSVKGKLKFYKNADDSDELALSFGINANHQPDELIYEKINDFLEQLLIDDYHSEEKHKEKKEAVKIEKQKVKYQLNQDKIRKNCSLKASKKTTALPTVKRNLY